MPLSLAAFGAVLFFQPMARQTCRLAAPPVMYEQPRDSAQQEAYEAGFAAASKSVQGAASKSAQAAGPEVKAFSVLLKSKPFGLLLEENPSGRGVSVSEVLNETAASRRGGIQVGDYVVGLSTKAGTADLTWLGLAEVQDLVGQASAPVTLRLRRGGPEPWTIQRDRQGLSIDDMVEETRREFGTLLDDEQEEALRSAFAAIKDDERRDASRRAGAGGYESAALQSVSRLSYELRAFTLGVQESLSRVVLLATNRALLDSRLAVKTAEYVLRRALFDTGRVLAAGRTALALGAAPTDKERAMQAEVSPFAARLSKISTVRQLGAGGGAGQRLALGAAAGDDDVDPEAARARQLAEKAVAEEALRREAGQLLREAIRGIEEWVREARRQEEQRGDGGGSGRGSAGAPSASTGPDWLRLQQRARVVGGDLGASLSASLDELRSDFSAYVQLDAQGQLPTLLEEAEDAAVVAVGGPRIAGGIFGGGGLVGSGVLGGLKAGDDAGMKRDRASRRVSELDRKKTKLAATVVARASKDVSDAAVFGVLPTAKAISRVAAQRAAQRIADSMRGGAAGAAAGQKAAGGGAGDLLGEIASEIADEYTRDIARGAKYGPLADAAEVLAGPTQAIKRDLEGAAALGMSALSGLLTPAAGRDTGDAPAPPASLGGAAAAGASVDSGAARRAAELRGRRDELRREVSGSPPAAAKPPAGAEAAVPEAAAPRPTPFLGFPTQGAAPPPPSARAPPPGVVEVEASVDSDVYEVEVMGPEETAPARGRAREQAGRQAGGRTSYADLEMDVETGVGMPMDVETGAGMPPRRAGDVDATADGSGDASGTGALEIDVSAQVDEDADQVGRERRARLLDSSLVLLEVTAVQASGAVWRLLTPEEGRSWELLHSLYEDGDKARARADKATAELVEELTRLVDRK